MYVCSTTPLRIHTLTHNIISLPLSTLTTIEKILFINCNDSMLFLITSNKKGKLMEILLMVDIKLFANIEFNHVFMVNGNSKLVKINLDKMILK